MPMYIFTFIFFLHLPIALILNLTKVKKHKSIVHGSKDELGHFPMILGFLNLC